MQLDIKEIRVLAEKYKDEMVKFCQELVQTPSVNGVHLEKKVAKLIGRKAKELDLPIKLISKNKKRPNIFIGRNFRKKTGLLFIAHLDTVPAGNKRKWRYPPFSGKIVRKRLYGRGAIDCKAGIALSIYTLKILKDLGQLDKAKFTGVADEESGADSDIGARYLLGRGLDAEAAIYTYPGIDKITIGHRGLVRAWVEVQGEAVHTGSKKWQTQSFRNNAIEALVDFLYQARTIKIRGKHKYFSGYSFKQTATRIQGGAGESIVPEKAKVLIDARLLPNQRNEEYIKSLKKLARRLEAEKIRFRILVKTNIPGTVISPKEKIVGVLAKLDKEVMSISPEIGGAGPANEGYMFINAGIPTICGFGAEGENAHSANEYLNIDSLPKILEIYTRTALELS
jgi:acetylornithine deacetylase/succinyl-diaminopimelate desuccinylase-like protein